MNKSLLTGALLAAAIILAAPAAYGQGVTLNLGKTEIGRYLNLVGNTAGSDGEITDMVYIAPEYAARNKGTSMYFDIDDSLFYRLPAGWRALVNVEYYDDRPGTQITLVYDALENHAGKEHAQGITTTGTNTWKSKSFTITDAYFGNGLAHNADFKLVAASGDTMTINAVSVAPFEAYIDYGTITDSLHLEWTERQGADSRTQIVTKEGEECVATIGTSQYLYVRVADSFLFSGKPTSNVFLTVEYYDSDPASNMRLQYDANTVPPNPYKATPYIYGRGRNNFRTFTFELPDAYFSNWEAGFADFRIQLYTPGLAVNRIMIARLKMKPVPVPVTIANTNAYKALESPTVDGTLGEWNWLAPTAIIPTFAGDGSRTDEFFRTWFQNPANVPIAEVGEPGVTDPGTRGSWDPKDLSGGVSVQWDDQNLYIAASVKDNVVNTSGTAWNTKDGFGFLIDCSHDYNTTGTAPIPRKDDQRFTQGEHFFFFPAEQNQAGTWRHSSSQEGEALPAQVTKAVTLTDSGYVIEASIPLSLIADGLTWHPGGVTGDKDAFNPLFAWMVNDNDGLSASSGRVMYGGHNEDDEFWGTLTMNPIPLVDHGIMIDLGAKNYESFLKQVETQAGGDGATILAERAGKNAMMLSSGYLYLDINDTIWNNARHPHVLVSIEYFDSAATGSRFRLQFDADTSAYASTPYIEIGSTGKWKTAIIELKNARFESRQNGHADLRIAASSGAKDVIINQVKVAMADLWIDLGDTTVSYGLKETSLGGDGRRAPATVGGINCKYNVMGGIIASHYFYHSVADTLIHDGDHKELFVTVEYYDTTSSGGLGMNYDGMGTIWSTPIGDAYILGERQWKLHTFFLPDAVFSNRMAGGDDFRIASKGNGVSFINRIMIGSLDAIVTSVDSHPAEPFTFRLGQNYPNPFNPSTTIAFTLSSRSFVSLKVFDIMGREVSTIASEDMPAGNYSRQWNASGFPSGVYFYRLQAGSHVETKRLILVK